MSHEALVEALGPDFQCRSQDCKGLAEFVAELPKQKHRARGNDGNLHEFKALEGEPWEGQFCTKHLLRALELVMVRIDFYTPITIKRINRA
jgi:hypothetical protein